jgi:spore photoproduct lyase
LDPLVAVEDWQDHYSNIIDEIFKRFEPERITLGTLRGLSSTIGHVNDKSWLKYLDESSSWGRKPSFERRLNMYLFIRDCLSNYGFSKIGVCKDTLAMWKALDKDFSKITCNCVF